MKRIIHQTHSKETFLYAASVVLERASHYGLRSLIVLYMISENLKTEESEALFIYGFFTASLVFSQILGAVFGDLLIGNKKAAIIGGIMQSLGACIFMIPSVTGLYIGLFFVVLGGGLYTPNITANFGKLYLNKTKLLDAGFTIFNSATNLGAFLGALAIGYTGEFYGWSMGFLLVGLLMLFSTCLILFSKDEKNEPKSDMKQSVNRVFKIISITFLLVGLFWGLYELGGFRISDLQLKLADVSKLNIPKNMWASLNSAITFALSLLAIVFWTFFYNSQFFKLAAGFIFGSISFGILLLIPEIPTEQHISVYMFSLLFLSVSEIHIEPIIHSVLAQYANPKYLAVLISLAFIPTRLFLVITGLFNDVPAENPVFGLKTGTILMTFVSISFIIFYIFRKKNRLPSFLR